MNKQSFYQYCLKAAYTKCIMMTTLRVSPEVSKKIKLLKRDGESVNEYLQRKTQQDTYMIDGLVEKSLLLQALDLLREEIANERFFPEPSENNIRMQAYYKARREQHDQNMRDSLAKSNRASERRLAGDDES